MKITRDVIFDLLPAYFAGEVSDDTRALIDEFLASDPEFARMMGRFRTLYDARQKAPADTSTERGQFERVRKRAERRQLGGAFAVAYGLAALFPLVLAAIGDRSLTRQGLVIMTVFGAVALAAAISWLVNGADRNTFAGRGRSSGLPELGADR